MKIYDYSECLQYGDGFLQITIVFNNIQKQIKKVSKEAASTSFPKFICTSLCVCINTLWKSSFSYYFGYKIEIIFKDTI